MGGPLAGLGHCRVLEILTTFERSYNKLLLPVEIHTRVVSQCALLSLLPKKPNWHARGHLRHRS